MSPRSVKRSAQGFIAAAGRLRPSQRRRLDLCALACAGVPDRLLRLLIIEGGLAALLELLGDTARELQHRDDDLAARAAATRQSGASPNPSEA